MLQGNRIRYSIVGYQLSEVNGNGCLKWQKSQIMEIRLSAQRKMLFWKIYKKMEWLLFVILVQQADRARYTHDDKRGICNPFDLCILLQITDMFDWQPHSNDSVQSMGSMMVDEDYMEFMSDTLFSTISANQPFAFPDPREISKWHTLLILM